MAFELFQADGTTVIPIRQPQRATWEHEPIGRFANGTPRASRFARVVWQYPRLTDAERAIFTANRPASGLMTFRTYRPPVGASPGADVKCTGVMEPITSGTWHQGEWRGVQVIWVRVEPV